MHHVSAGTCASQKRVLDNEELGGCELPDVSAGNQILVLCNGSMSHFSRPSEMH